MAYANGKVYKIIGDLDGPCYVGSTINHLSERLMNHKSGYKKWKNDSNARYMRSFDIFDQYGFDECTIVLLECCNVQTRVELLQREQHYIDTLDCVNHINAINNEDQKRAIRKKWADAHPEHKKEYYIKNKEKIKQQSIEYYYENQEACSARNKIWRANNQDKIKQDMKTYAEKNKERIKAQREVDVYCDVCKYSVQKKEMKRHERTIRHVTNLGEQEPDIEFLSD